MKQFRLVILAAMGIAALGAVVRTKYKATALAGDTAWIAVAVAGLSGQLQAASEWLNANVGTWSFILGVLGLAASFWTKRRMVRAAEQGRFRLEEVARD